jgi:LEA14-like dessication related protein
MIIAKRFLLTTALVGAILLMSCAAMKELVQAPSVSINTVKIADASFEDVTLNFDLLVSNPNQFGIQLSGFDYAFQLENKEFLSGEDSNDLRVASGAQSHVNIPVTLNFQQVFKLAKEFESLDSLDYNISGHFKPGGLLAGFNIPFSKTGSLPNVRIPKIKFNGLKVNSLGFGGVDLELGVGIDNNNVFGFDIGKLDYKINLAGTEVANGVTENLAKIPGKGKGEIKLPIKMSFMSLAGPLRSALTGEAVDATIQGGANLNTPFGVFELPINTQQKVNIFK